MKTVDVDLMSEGDTGEAILPVPHADRDGSERRRSMEREHERGLAADKVEGRCRICGHGTDSDQLACAPCRAVIAGDRYAKEGWLRAERAEAALARVEHMHRDQWGCCMECGGEMAVPWPCDTIKAIRGDDV